MKNKLKTIFVSLAVLASGLGPAIVLPASVNAAADIKTNVCGGVEIQVDGGNCGNIATGATGLQTLVTNIVNVLSIIVGIVAVIMIILGGFKYITSGGDSGSISSAKTTIIYAIVGLVIVALAQVIVRFVLSKATA